jgi:glycosyltransferase involved in cell wall biosynthesis
LERVAELMYETLDRGKYGHLIPVGDSDAIAAAIFSVLAGHSQPLDPQWLDQFTSEICVQKYLDVLNIS